MSTILEALSQNIMVDKDKCVFCAKCAEACLLDNIRFKIAPCRKACPLDLNCHGYIQLLARGREEDALALIRETLPFPAILGRICHHPCEDSCSRREVDQQPVAIKDLKRYLADRVTLTRPLDPIRERQEKVAIIGAGPAGAYAAYTLRQKGYQVTVYEAGSRLGGMAARAIPEFRLPSRIVASEFGILADMGVKIVYNTTVGQDISLNSLIDSHQAVLIAVGAPESKKLRLQGEEATNVYNALDFLQRAKQGEDKPRVGNRAIVIGGGNTALDAAQTAMRSGAREVQVYCLEAADEMPAFPWEVADALEEGIAIKNGWGPVQFLTRGEAVTAIQLERCLSVFDQNHNFSPVFAHGETITVPADTVIVAIGQNTDLCLLSGTGIATRQNLIAVDPVTLQTSNRTVFAAGDAASGPRSVVEALAQGREAAESIHRLLNGLPLAYGRDRYAACVTDYAIDYTLAQPGSRVRPSRTPLNERRTFREIEHTLTGEQAVKEACRCLSCGEPYGKYRTCWSCLACEVECPEEAIDVRVPYLMR